MAIIKGMIRAVCISKKKGTVKRNINSGYFKKGVGLAGDAHSGTERQVSLLRSEDIKQTKKIKIKPGDFAENLIIEGLKYIPVIGTLLNIGKTAVLRVTQLGKECHTGCRILKLTGKCIMPKLGIFAEVLTSGWIKVGDKVVVNNNHFSSSQKIFTAAVLTISDRASKGIYEDESGKVLKELLLKSGFELKFYETIPDNISLIKKKLIYLSDKMKVKLVLTTGGTGLSKTDVTPEATSDIIEKEVPGIILLSVIEGIKKTVFAALSRGIAGIRKKTLIINLPGSPRGARESFLDLSKVIPHALNIIG